jgi:hypothetical protein
LTSPFVFVVIYSLYTQRRLKGFGFC